MCGVERIMPYGKRDFALRTLRRTDFLDKILTQGPDPLKGLDPQGL